LFLSRGGRGQALSLRLAEIGNVAIPWSPENQLGRKSVGKIGRSVPKAPKPSGSTRSRLLTTAVREKAMRLAPPSSRCEQPAARAAGDGFSFLLGRWSCGWKNVRTSRAVMTDGRTSEPRSIQRSFVNRPPIDHFMYWIDVLHRNSLGPTVRPCLPASGWDRPHVALRPANPLAIQRGAEDLLGRTRSGGAKNLVAVGRRGCLGTTEPRVTTFGLQRRRESTGRGASRSRLSIFCRSHEASGYHQKGTSAVRAGGGCSWAEERIRLGVGERGELLGLRNRGTTRRQVSRGSAERMMGRWGGGKRSDESGW